MVLPGANRASDAGEISVGAGNVVGVLEGGLTVRVAVRVTLPFAAVIVTEVELVTDEVVIPNWADVAPAATVTLAGTTAAAFELAMVTTRPPLGAALVSVAVPVALLPPTTLVGLTLSVDSVGVVGVVVDCAVNRRVLEKGPFVPDALTARTRQNKSRAGSPETVAVETLTLAVYVSGVVKLLEVSIWMTYVAALATSLQSNVIGCATVARSAGDTNVGADSGPVGADSVTLIDVN
jgi:hypothetical protein